MNSTPCIEQFRMPTPATSPVELPTPDLFRLVGLDDGQLLALCRENDPLKIERDAHGGLHIMAPTGSEGSSNEFEVGRQLGNWIVSGRHGRGFSSSGGFSLPSGRMLAADAAFVSLERWSALSPTERSGFARIAPDFVVEIQSPSDSRPVLCAKMEQWIEDGVRLAWLIDPQSRSVVVYRPDRAPETFESPQTVTGDDDVLPGFVLDLSLVWD